MSLLAQDPTEDTTEDTFFPQEHDRGPIDDPAPALRRTTRPARHRTPVLTAVALAAIAVVAAVLLAPATARAPLAWGLGTAAVLLCAAVAVAARSVRAARLLRGRLESVTQDTGRLLHERARQAEEFGQERARLADEAARDRVHAAENADRERTRLTEDAARERDRLTAEFTAERDRLAEESAANATGSPPTAPA